MRFRSCRANAGARATETMWASTPGLAAVTASTARDNAGNPKPRQSNRCLRRSEGWPGPLPKVCPVAAPASTAAPTAATAAATPAAAAAPAAAATTRRIGTTRKRVSASGTRAERQTPSKRRKGLRTNPQQVQRLERNTRSAEKDRQGPRKRSDVKSDGDSPWKQKRQRKATSDAEQKSKAERVAADEKAAAELAAEEELLGADLSGKDIRFLGRRLGLHKNKGALQRTHTRLLVGACGSSGGGVIFMAERILSGGVWKLWAKSGRPRGKD